MEIGQSLDLMRCGIRATDDRIRDMVSTTKAGR